MPYGGVTVKDVSPHDFVKALSEWLKLLVVRKIIIFGLSFEYPPPPT